MTERERRFCELYAGNPNATEAAKAAGYSPRTAYSQGSRLLRNVEVLEYINELQEGLASRRIASMAQVRAFWCDTMRDTTQKMADRLKASELLAKSAGEFIHLGQDDGGAGVLRGKHNGEDLLIVLPDNGRDPELMQGKFVTEMEAMRWDSDR